LRPISLDARKSARGTYCTKTCNQCIPRGFVGLPAGRFSASIVEHDARVAAGNSCVPCAGHDSPCCSGVGWGGVSELSVGYFTFIRDGGWGRASISQAVAWNHNFEGVAGLPPPLTHRPSSLGRHRSSVGGDAHRDAKSETDAYTPRQSSKDWPGLWR
jgi:hypothetical protein